MGSQDRQNRVFAVSGGWKEIFSLLVLPALFMQIVQIAGWLGEAFFVSKLGKIETAAIGLVGEISWVLSTLTTIVTIGTTTLVAQRWGAGDKEGANSTTVAAIQQSILCGLFASSVWFLQDFIWMGMGADVEVRKAARFYLLVSLISFPLMNFAATISASLRGLGDMKTPLLVSFVAAIVHLSLNALLVPIWGLEGAAMALAVSRIVAVSVFAICIKGTHLNITADRLTVWHNDYHCELLKLGIPAGAQTLFWSLSSVAFFSLLNRMRDGTEAVAAFTVGIRIESLAFMVAMAFGMATQTLVGQSIGAGNLRRAWLSTWYVTLWCILAMLPICTLLFFGAGVLASHFSKDPLTRHYIASYLKVAAIAEPFWALSTTTGAALQGAGDTRTPALVAIVTQWLFCIPLTYFSCIVKGYSPTAAWLLVGASGLLTGAITAAAWVVLFKRIRVAAQI